MVVKGSVVNTINDYIQFPVVNTINDYIQFPVVNFSTTRKYLVVDTS
jgi:hypothetical protein